MDQENWNKISHFISTDISRAAAAVQRHNELEPYIYPLEFLNFDIDTVINNKNTTFTKGNEYDEKKSKEVAST